MTIKDLAKLSGYSLGTVSRVLNNQPNVSEQARKTILALVEEHGFERNASAQLLKQQRTKSVLIIVKGTSNEMFAAMVEKLQSLFADTDHPVIADFIDEDENRSSARCSCAGRESRVVFCSSAATMKTSARILTRFSCRAWS